MRKTVGMLLACSLVLAWSGLAWSGEDVDPKAVVAQALKAMGGEAKLAKHKAATWTEKGTYYGQGNGQDFTGKYAVRT
jgi:hypothetical protein